MLVRRLLLLVLVGLRLLLVLWRVMQLVVDVWVLRHIRRRIRRERRQLAVCLVGREVLVGVGGHHSASPLDLRLFHADRAVDAVQFVVEACKRGVSNEQADKTVLVNIPQALQMVWPLSSRLHSGVMVVPQF